jgi:signal recognition particle receptor subunit beta
MATIDDARGVLVIRIVYDGPAFSGKTTSLRALARGVSRTVECPDEHDGRTLFFDWVDYVGGIFEGRQIRCQIVSVPGQRELSHRRKLILEDADAIVVVLDSRREEWNYGFGWLRDVIPYCRGKDPPVGLVLQANKRDAPSSLTREEIRESLDGLPPVAVVDSVATTGDGIREAFVLAVRLALDRVRALSASGRLPVGRPSENDAAELLLKMTSSEERASVRPVDASVMVSVQDAVQAELERWIPEMTDAVPGEQSADGERLFTPDPTMPGGMIWPPVDGRALLHEVAPLGIRPLRTLRSDWWGAGSGWRVHSVGGAIFGDPNLARHELIEWARLHSANARHLSAGRAVILADAGGGRLRLWQLVRADAVLRERLDATLSLGEPGDVAKGLLEIAGQLAAAREAFREASANLPCTLWTVGTNHSYRPLFVGLMPGRDNRLPKEPEGEALFEREFLPRLRELRQARVDYGDVVARILALTEISSADAAPGWLARTVASA